RQPAAEAGVPLVARALPVLADLHLLAEHVVDDARRHRRRGREVGLAVAADKQDARLEGLPGLRLDAVHEEPLALLDAVLLAAAVRAGHCRGGLALLAVLAAARAATRLLLRGRAGRGTVLRRLRFLRCLLVLAEVGRGHVDRDGLRGRLRLLLRRSLLALSGFN